MKFIIDVTKLAIGLYGVHNSIVIKNLVLLLGISLFVINIAGMFMSLRNIQIYSETKGIVLTEHQLWEQIERDSSNVPSYVQFLNTAINKGIAHYWNDESIQKYNLRIPFYENYLLYIASWIYPDGFQKHEFHNYKKAIERGVGLCSQQSIIITEILKTKQIESKIVKLSGHVVATVAIDKGNQKKWWILDPDYGVVIPFSINTIEHDPNIIASYYFQAGYNESTVSNLVNIYGSEGNLIVSGASEYDPARFYFEKITYVLKWLLPLLLILYSIILSQYSSKQKNLQ